MKLQDLTGQKFNRLTVVKYLSKSKWLCKCDCGNETIVLTGHLKSGHTKSCGCYNSELTTKRNTKHGLSHTRLFKIWSHIKARCYNSKCERYINYGGRGIIICEEWRNSFKSFYDWAMANGYQEDLSIERINNNGNYEPNNCKWIPMEQQAKNKQNSVFYSFNGRNYSLKELSELFNINKGTLQSRLQRKWSIEKALSTKVREIK